MVRLRGVDQSVMMVHQKVRIVEGRKFEGGRNEVIVGQGAASEFAGLDLGATLQMGKERWKIVGIFTAAGGIEESRIWADSSTLHGALLRGATVQPVLPCLATPAPFWDLTGAFIRCTRADAR